MDPALPDLSGDEEQQHDDPDTPYTLRPDWADVTPLDPDAGLPAVVAVQYEGQDREVLGYFHAVLQSGELSTRVLALTEEVILVNSANYTAWDLRWRCLQVLPGAFMAAEPAFLGRMLDANPKNYQLWNYRRRFALHRGPQHAAEELAYIDACLQGDAKNYHAWSHRAAVAERFGLWPGELPVVSRLIELDVRNNSAWNHRFFAASHLASQRPAEEVFAEEVAYASAHIRQVPHNESAWNYLRGLCTCLGLPHKLALDTSLFRLCCEVLERSPSCSPAIELLADIYAAQAQLAQAQQAHAEACAAAANGQHCFQQLEVADPIRGHYWRHRQRELQAL